MLPLYTSPAIEYLGTIIRPEWKVFEYGGGHSSGYYSTRCQESHVVEHNGTWVGEINSISPSSVVHHIEAHHAVCEQAAGMDAEFFQRSFDLPLVEGRPDYYNQYHGIANDEYRGYASMLATYPQGYFDCIVVDGMARSLCLWYACKLVKPDGLIILDNSDRWLFNSLQCHLVSEGFNRKDFWQPEHPCWCTSFFSRTNDASDTPCGRPIGTGDIYHFG